MAEQAIGVVGLATMGMNLARNLASHGASVAVYNRTQRRTDEFMSAFAGEGDFHPAFTLEELTKALRPPRAILIMVKAGAPVDEAIDALSLILKPGDTLIDGGNASLRQAIGPAANGLAAIFRAGNGGELQSSLIETPANVLAKRDDGAGAALVDQIEDEAEQKGPGRWTSQSALELGVPLTGITEAGFARMLSSQKRERMTASSILAGPCHRHPPAAEPSALGREHGR